MPSISPGARFVRYLWIVLTSILILMATYVSIGRLVMPRLENYQAEIEAIVSERLGMQVSAEKLMGGWQNFQPTAKLQHIAITPVVSGDSPKPAFEINTIELRLDVLASLLSQKAVFSSLMLDGSHFELIQNENGKWRFPSVDKVDKAETKNKANPLEWLLLQKHVLLKNISVSLTSSHSSAKEITIPEWGLNCSGRICATQGTIRLQSDAEDSLQLAANIYGRPGERDFQLHGYLNSLPVQLVDWLFVANQLPAEISNVESLSIGGEVWFEWGDGQLLDIRGQVALPEVKLTTPTEQVEFGSVRSRFFWQKNSGLNDGIWELSLDQFSFEWAGQAFAPARRHLAMLKTEKGRELHVWADKIELQPLNQLLLTLKSAPAKLNNALSALQPSGQLQNVHLSYPLEGDIKTANFNLEASLDNVSVAAWRGSPTLVAVNGYLQAGLDSGLVDFESENLALQFPKVFSDIWLFEKAQGVVSWQREGKAFWLNGQNLKLHGQVGDITGRFAFVSSKGEFEPRLSLLIGLENSQLPEAMTFVPDVVMSPKLGDWLAQAFTKGEIEQTGFVLEQNVTKGAPEISRSLAMLVKAKDVGFSFHPDWPLLTQADVGVQILDKSVNVTADRARFFDLALQNITANYQVDTNKQARLRAAASVSGSLKDAWQVLTETPLQKNTFALANDFQFEGKMQGNLSLDLPFQKPKQSLVSIDFLTRDASLSIPPLSLSADRISGVFKYDSGKGLSARSVSARMFGYPLALSIGSQKNSQGIATQFDVQGRVDVASLAPWVPAAVMSHLKGETSFQALLDLGQGSDNTFEIHSNLDGIEVNLPEPFAKPVEQAEPFSFTLALAGPQIHNLQYADKFAYNLLFKDKNYQSGVVSIGPIKYQNDSTSGIQVKGAVSELDFKQWQTLLDGAATDKSFLDDGKPEGATLVNNISDVSLKVGRFRFLDQDYEQVQFSAKQQAGDWALSFSNPLAQGALNYAPAKKKTLAVDFDYLHLPVNESIPSDRKDTLANWVPQQLPELDLNVNQLFLGQQPFGRWSFQSRLSEQGMTFENLSFEFKGLQGEGVLDWSYVDNNHRTDFEGVVTIPDVAAALKSLGVSAAVEAEDAVFSGSLSWPGSPDAFSLLDAQGRLSMTAEEGRLVDLKAQPLLGVFNFNNLSRRLRLDFSDLFEKGFSFDEAKGAFDFQSGMVLLTEPLVIEGPSAKFKVEGKTDLRNELFDHDVIAVLPVTDSIPVLATLAGFPQIGIPVYLFNRSFGDMFDRFTSVNYQVTGSWRDPEVKLTSFFKSDDLNEGQGTKQPKRPKR